MDTSALQNRRRLIFIILITIFVVIPLVVLVISQSVNKNKFGNSTNIDGISSIKNISQEFKDSITASLFNTLSLNGISNPVNDSVIRKDSAVQNEVKRNTQYNGTFIIDIESIKQSYFVEYFYTKNIDDGFIGGYPVIVKCLDKELLLYGDFNCKDIISVENTGIDPIINTLPYTSLNYEIKGSEDDTGKVTLHVKLLLTEIDYKDGKDAAIDKYKKDALKKITSMGYNPDTYTIQYSY